MTFKIAIFGVITALILGVAVGRFRGPIIGIGMGLAVLVLVVIGYVVLLTLALPM